MSLQNADLSYYYLDGTIEGEAVRASLAWMMRRQAPNKIARASLRMEAERMEGLAFNYRRLLFETRLAESDGVIIDWQI